MTEMNTLEIDGYRALVQYDPEIEMFRGEFLGLNGGADFYATTVKALHSEGKKSLKVFLEMCKESGIEPLKKYSGKFNLRVEPAVHARIAIGAAAEGKSLNQFVSDLLVSNLETFPGESPGKQTTGYSLAAEQTPQGIASSSTSIKVGGRTLKKNKKAKTKT